MSEGALSATVLIIDDDLTFSRALALQLKRQQFPVILAATGEEALNKLRTHDVALALVDYGLPDTNGVVLTRLIKQEWTEVEVLAITGTGSIEVGMEMLRAGASEYFDKPISDMANFYEMIRRAQSVWRESRHDADLIRLRGELKQVAEQGKGVHRIVGRSRAIDQLKRDLSTFSTLPVSENVLLLGEPGVGKTHAARAFHEQCGSKGRFANVNAATLDKEFRALFGNGPFPGVPAATGWCQKVRDGTLFIDEIGELDLEGQKKLLKLVEEREFVRYGGSETENFQGRLVLATNRDLADDVQNGRFRRDLYHRIRRWETTIPPLRERPEDIPALAYFLVHESNHRYKRAVRSISPDAIALLRRAPWVGNVRELNDIIVQAVVRLGGRDEMTATLLRTLGLSEAEPADVSPAGAVPSAASAPRRAHPAARAAAGETQALTPRTAAGPSLATGWLELAYKDAKEEVLTSFSSWYLKHQLARANGNKTVAAELSGMQRPNFSRLMKRFGVDAADTPTTQRSE